MIHYSYYYSCLTWLVNRALGSSRLFLISKAVDGRVTCPRSSVCTVLLHTRTALATKRRCLFICSQLQTAFSQGLVNFYCTVPSRLFHSGPSVFLISFPTFLVFLFSFSLLRCPATISHFPPPYSFLLHTVPVCGLAQVHAWFSPAVHTWLVLH